MLSVFDLGLLQLLPKVPPVLGLQGHLLLPMSQATNGCSRRKPGWMRWVAPGHLLITTRVLMWGFFFFFFRTLSSLVVQQLLLILRQWI